MGKIKVIKVEPHKAPYVDEIEDYYETFSKYVGGYIEYVRIDDEIAIICNEEGKLLNLEPNRYIKDGEDVVCGNFIIVALSPHGEERSLTDFEINKYIYEFKETPEIDPKDVSVKFEFYAF